MQGLNFLHAGYVAATAILWAPSCSFSTTTKVCLTALGALALLKEKVIDAISIISSSSQIASDLGNWQESFSQFTASRGNRSHSYTTARDNLRVVQPAASALMQELFTKHITQEPVLELGSHLLNEQGQSYLAELVPDASIIYSDYNNKIVTSESKKTIGQYIQLDATTLAGVKDSALTQVVALNVFDTLERNRLPDAASALYRTLKPGGKALILADLPFEQKPFLQKHAQEGKILIPYMDKGVIGAKIVAKETLLAASELYGEAFYRFVLKITNLPPEEAANFLFLLFQRLNSLPKVLGSICSKESYEVVDHRESYLADLTAAITSQKGLTIVENGYQQKTIRLHETLETDEPINYLSSDVRHLGVVLGRHLSQIPQGFTEYSTTAHVVVIQKV